MKIKVVVLVRGGAVQEVFCSHTNVKVTIVDIDEYKDGLAMTNKECDKAMGKQIEGLHFAKWEMDMPKEPPKEHRQEHKEWPLKLSSNCRYRLKKEPVLVSADEAEKVIMSWENDKKSFLANGARLYQFDLEKPKYGIWTGKTELPKIGTKVKVLINRLGTGTVKGYFIEHAYLGVEVALDNQPEWHKKQNGVGTLALIFGVETKEVDCE